MTVSGQSGTGLHSPAFERDGCGFGLIAQMDDVASHWLVHTAIASLARLTSPDFSPGGPGHQR